MGDVGDNTNTGCLWAQAAAELTPAGARLREGLIGRIAVTA